MATTVDYLERAAAVRFVISFDLEITPSMILENQIWRPPLDSVVVTALDARQGGLLFGATQQAHPWRMWLLPERTPSTYTFAHVVEHELLHAIGCDHVADKASVMYEFTRPGVFEALQLTDTDRAEIARALAAR